MKHRIVTQALNVPYRRDAHPSSAAPVSIFPVSAETAAKLATGELTYTVVLSVDQIAAEMESAGLLVTNLLDDQPEGELPRSFLAWRVGGRRGTLHRRALEQLAIELTDLRVWAKALATSPLPPRYSARWGSYLCLANEGDVWQ